MREHPDLEQLRRQAKELLRDFAARRKSECLGRLDRLGVYAAFSHKPWELVELLHSRGGLVSAATGGVGVENGTRYDC